MSMLRLYKSYLPTVNYILGNGKPAIFIEGRYATEVESEIAELDNEVRLKHPHIYIDDAEKEVDSVKVDPIEALTTRIREELREEMKLASMTVKDMGTSVPGKLMPANSTDISSATLGSGSSLSPAGMASLVNLTVKK